MRPSISGRDGNSLSGQLSKEILLSLLLVLLLGLSMPGWTVAARGEPDLVVENLDISPSNPRPGEKVYFRATVANRGAENAFPSFYVRFEVDGMKIDQGLISGGLRDGEREIVEANWTAQAGTHRVKVIADRPFDKIDESNEENNELESTILVRERVGGTPVGELKLAVARFDDRSGSGLANVGEGVGDMLVGKLVESGFRVLERAEIDSILMERNLNAGNTNDLAKAGRILGADVLIVGSVTDIDIAKSSLSIGFISVSGASVKVEISFRLVNAYSGEILGADSVTAQKEGQTDFSFDVGKLIKMTGEVRKNVCLGGFRADKNNYYQGEIINFGYKDPSPSSWFRVKVAGPSFPGGLWLGWQSSAGGNNCARWSWSPPTTLSPGNYSATLYRGGTWMAVASTNFSVLSGSGGGPGWAGELTVGSSQFSSTIAGQALEEALEKTTARVAGEIRPHVSELIAQRGAVEEEPVEEGPGAEETINCRVIQPQGERAIIGGISDGCGANAGVEEDDIFLVFSAQEVRDQGSGELIEIIPLEETNKGKVIVTAVFNDVARVEMIGDFELLQGDLLVLKE